MSDRALSPGFAVPVEAAAAAEPPRFDRRTLLLLEGPIAPTLLRLALPNVLVMIAQSSVGLIETYFVGRLGTDALAGLALVFPVLMTTQMMSAGAVGGGISSSIARALGRGERSEADALALHALVLSAGFGLVFTAAVLGLGRPLYAAMGGRGGSLAAALLYSNVVFAGAVLLWIFNALGNIIRGSGNMAVPAWITWAGVVLLVPLSPCLIFGLGPFPRLGVAGGAYAVLVYYGLGTAALAAYLWSGRCIVRPSLALGFRRAFFADILRVGAVAAVISFQTNLTIACATGFVGKFGPAAIAGYGTGSRLEYLLVPIAFGFGAPLVAMVGTNIGAGRRERALRTAWIGALCVAAVTEVVGVLGALFPEAWLGLFGRDPVMLAAGARYLHWVGPVYGLFGLGMGLYFASQGAGRLLWPFVANLSRLAIAALGGGAALLLGFGLDGVFASLALGLAAMGGLNAIAVAGGAWFGPLQLGGKR